jgi:hypothetical protein
MDIRRTQLRVLDRLLRKTTGTAYAIHYGISSGITYDVFKSMLPLCRYDDLEPWVERCKSGESDVLWPGLVRRFAVSAGTTGKGKHIPIYDDRISTDLSFMRSVMRHIVRDNPDPGLFLGKHIALSGSVESIGGLQFGEISGMLACASPRWIRPWHIICPEQTAHMAWPERYQVLLQSSIRNDIRVITGVPTWILILLRDATSSTGKPIDHIWPNLKLIVTGGVALSGYYDAIQSELGNLNVRFLENYGASEGYFAYDWYERESMLLQYNTDVFYEFVPIDEISGEFQHQRNADIRPIPLWEIQTNVRYALVVTSIGLTRYITNDEVIFDSIEPPRLRVTGRLNEMTDTFGEAVTALDVRTALKRALPNSTYNHVHVCPTWSGIPNLPAHEWIIVFDNPELRSSLTLKSIILANEIDHHLRSINRHYAIRRETKAMELPLLHIIGLDEYEDIIRELPQSQSKLGMFLK